MIKSVHIKKFKSIVDLSLDLGTFNVLIGENGCGKSNILEAIAFGAAASADKLDFEFLGSRGIRVTNPEFMYSAFTNGPSKKNIEVNFSFADGIFKEIKYLLTHEANNPRKWINVSKEVIGKAAEEKLASILFDNNKIKRKKELAKLFHGEEQYIIFLEKLTSDIENITKEMKGKPEDKKGFFSFLFNKFLSDRFSNQEISNYIVYSPEQSSLRKFEETTQIYPLGIRGEGLFQYLKELASKKAGIKTLINIKNNLMLLDWYEGFELPQQLLENEFSLRIKDKYLYENLKYFDQRSANEGFLFLLFYSALFISKSTPAFFAIDNIDNSFNPKLCRQLILNLTSLARKYKKQVIVTTQNPAILDGLNLKDNNQRLFVVRRNEVGHTKAKRIEYKAERKLKLSEIWTNGFIGGLPENF